MMLEDRLNRLLDAVRTIEARSLTAVLDALVARAAGTLEILTRHAARALEALTAFKAGCAVAGVASVAEPAAAKHMLSMMRKPPRGDVRAC